MADTYRIDSHKLIYHPERVAAWRAAGDDWEKHKKIYPIYVEISTSGNCNHRCTFCAVDYIGYNPVFLSQEVLDRTLADMAAKGVKSVMFAGEGEPLLMKGLADSIVRAKPLGLDFAITTNGTAMTDSFIDKALQHISWIKVSLNAGDAESYAKVHRTQARDFDRVWANLAKAVEAKRKHGWGTVLGAQAVLVPENLASMEALCQRGRDAGLDYVVIKPYSQHLKSEETKARGYENFKYSEQAELGRKLEALSTDSFQVVFRWNTMQSLEEERHYQKCYSTPSFWAYVMANGDVYGCSAYLLDERFNYGNLNESGFSAIWEGEKRRKNFEYVRHELDISECRKNCRMEHVNRYLSDLQNPNPHVNFI